MKQGVDHVNLTETSVGLSKDDTKAAARQSLNCIKNKKNKIKYGEKRFSIWRWNSYTLQCDMWLWNRDSEITKWQHPTMWQVALG